MVPFWMTAVIESEGDQGDTAAPFTLTGATEIVWESPPKSSVPPTVARLATLELVAVIPPPLKVRVPPLVTLGAVAPPLLLSTKLANVLAPKSVRFEAPFNVTVLVELI
jgi:hypothetical protein